MELQIVDSNGTAWFRILRGEPLWWTFHRSLHDAALLPFHGAELDDDLEMRPDQIQAASSGLESALRDELNHALARGRARTGPPRMAIGSVQVTVLGERLTLDLRTDDDLALSRTNDLVVALQEVCGSGRSLHVLIVPDWPRATRTLALLLSREPGPVSRDDLRERLFQRLEEMKVRSEDPETVRARIGDAELVRRRGLDDMLGFLTTWRMATEIPGGGIRATDKLRLIKL